MSAGVKPIRPLTDMHYLDGFLMAAYEDDDAPDGAWLQRMADMIAEHWHMDQLDAHDCVMDYLLWKRKQRG